MKPDPVLASKTLPASREAGRRHPHTFRVEGGLHYIRGNDKPYFSLTYTEHRQGFPSQEESGGCNPELILRHFPQFADLAVLHLSDIDGVPMHAEANGWYQLAGALGGFGEKYHAGNQKGNYPLPASRLDPANPWITTEYRLPTRQECLGSFARHCRVSIGEARNVAGFVKATSETYQINDAKGKFPRWINEQRPRWKREADACILAHRLQVYGDPWQGPVPECLTAQPPAEVPAELEPTYIDRWGIAATAAKVDRNPNMDDSAGDMTHYRVTLRFLRVGDDPVLSRRKLTVYYSMGSAHAGREPTAQEVIDCIAQDAADVNNEPDFEHWASGLGYDTDNRKAHRTYTICKRQGERLQKFLGADHYAELMGGGVMGLPDRLTSWAQNEENIDGHYLEHGRDCLEAAEVIRELAEALEYWLPDESILEATCLSGDPICKLHWDKFYKHCTLLTKAKAGNLRPASRSKQN